jgi:hypothetical protein
MSNVGSGKGQLETIPRLTDKDAPLANRSSFEQAYVDLCPPARSFPPRDLTQSQKSGYEADTGVHAWISVTQDRDYTIFDDCKDALRRHLVSPQWHDLLASTSYGAIVDLGVGGAEKLCIALQSLQTSKSPKIPVVIYADISKSMLRYAYNNINSMEFSTTANQLIPVRLDFVDHFDNLYSSPRLYGCFPSSRNTIFFMLGCTFGNFREAALITRLGDSLRAGDVLIVGVELHELSDGRQQAASDFLKLYNSRGIRMFGDVVAKSMLDPNIDYTNSIEARIETTSPHSDIPKTWSILSEVITQPATQLLMSNRYHEGEFIRFFEAARFTHLYSIAATRNPFYKHFVFRMAAAPRPVTASRQRVKS